MKTVPHGPLALIKVSPLQIDGEAGLIGNKNIADGSWKHLAVSFPAGSLTLEDAVIYIDGEAVDAEATFLGNPYSLGPVVWYDAHDIDGDWVNTLPFLVQYLSGKIRVETVIMPLQMLEKSRHWMALEAPVTNLLLRLQTENIWK